MGLDQYAFSVNPEEWVLYQGDNTYDFDRKELAYWRKHNRLQSWIEQVWLTRGHTQEQLTNGDCNCEFIELSLEDIEKLEEDVITLALPEIPSPNKRLFFGQDSYSPVSTGIDVADLTVQSIPNPFPYYDYETDRQFVTDAKVELSKGNIILYWMWW